MYVYICLYIYIDVCVCVCVCVCVYRFRAALLPPFFILAGLNTLRVIADVSATVEASRAPKKNGLCSQKSPV